MRSIESKEIWAKILLIGLLLVCLFNLFLTVPVQAAPLLDTNTKVADANYFAFGPALLPLPDGRLIKIGGDARYYCSQYGHTCRQGSKDTEIFNPTNSSWLTATAMQTGRYDAMAVVLNNGKVLVTGGMTEAIPTFPFPGDPPTYSNTDSSELYDPANNTWQTTGALGIARYNAGITLLPDGRVLVVGGYSYAYNPHTSTPTLLETSEIYAPNTGKWSTLVGKSGITGQIKLFALDNGSVLALNSRGEVATFDPLTEIWVKKSSAVVQNSSANFSLVKLANGQILALSTNQYAGHQIYNLAADTWQPFTGSVPSTQAISLDPYPVVAFLTPLSNATREDRKLVFLNLASGISTTTAGLYPWYMGHHLNYLGDGKLLVSQGYTETNYIALVPSTPYPYKDSYLYQSDLPADLPATPTKLEVGKIGNSILFKWQDRATNEDGYIIERKVATDSTWQEIARTPANATSFSDTTPPADTRLDYRISAFKGANLSLGLEAANLQAGTLPVYRFYRLSNGTHFYTIDEKEKNTLIEKYASEMKYEGVAYKSYDLSNAALIPVYRFYNKGNNAHFYTSNPAEKDALIANWSQVYLYEGIAFYAQAYASDNTLAVYRFYNYQTKAHFYTSNPAEKDALIANWKQLYNYEGIAFYAF